MEKAGAGWYQAIILPGLLGVTVVECGQVLMISSITLGLQLEWDLNDGQKALLPALAFAGLGLGTICSGFLSDSIGRRRTILLGYVGSAISAIALAMSAGYRQMCVLCLINGILCGVPVTAALVLITELCPTSIRAMAFVMPLLAQAFGEIYAATMINLFMPDLVHGNWRNALICNSFPALAFLFVSWFILPESPCWLMVKGRVTEARSEIREIARANNTLSGVEALLETLEADPAAKEQESQLVKVRNAMNSSRFCVVAASMTFLCFLGQLLTFGMNYFWPALLGNTVLEGISLNPAAELGLIRSFGVPSALLMIPIMRSSIGHKWIIGVAAISMAITLQGCIVVLTRQEGLALIPLAGLSLACANLFYSATLLFMTESFPTTLRAVMSACAVFVGRSGALLGPTLIDVMGYKGFLSLVIGLSTFAVPVLMLLSETKGRQLEDYLPPGGAATGCGDEEAAAGKSGVKAKA